MRRGYLENKPWMTLKSLFECISLIKGCIWEQHSVKRKSKHIQQRKTPTNKFKQTRAQPVCMLCCEFKEGGANRLYVVQRGSVSLTLKLPFLFNLRTHLNELARKRNRKFPSKAAVACGILQKLLLLLVTVNQGIYKPVLQKKEGNSPLFYYNICCSMWVTNMLDLFFLTVFLNQMSLGDISLYLVTALWREKNDLHHLFAAAQSSGERHITGISE